MKDPLAVKGIGALRRGGREPEIQKKIICIISELPDVWHISRDVVLGSRIKIVFTTVRWSIQTLQLTSQIPPWGEIQKLLQFNRGNLFTKGTAKILHVQLLISFRL